MLSYTLINTHSQVSDPGPSCLSSFLNADFFQNQLFRNDLSVRT